MSNLYDSREKFYETLEYESTPHYSPAVLAGAKQFYKRLNPKGSPAPKFSKLKDVDQLQYAQLSVDIIREYMKVAECGPVTDMAVTPLEAFAYEMGAIDWVLQNIVFKSDLIRQYYGDHRFVDTPLYEHRDLISELQSVRTEKFWNGKKGTKIAVIYDVDDSNDDALDFYDHLYLATLLCIRAFTSESLKLA